MKKTNLIINAVKYILILSLGLIFIIPLLWMITISLGTPEEASRPGIHLIPSSINLENYKTALTIMPFAKYALNTLIVTGLTIFGTVLSSGLVGYAFAKLRAPGKNALFVLMLSTIMLPAMVTMIPMFVIFKSLGWYDTLLPLIVPSFFGNAFYIFLIRQFFLTIPPDIEEAAKMDGCGYLRIFFQIMMPLSKPVLVSVGVFSFVAHWNDFMTPLIYLNSVEHRTLALGLATYTDVWGVDIVSLMAASTAVLLPVLIIFFFAQRYFVQGVVMSGIKG